MSLTPNWSSLTDESAWTLVNVAWPMSSGASVKELAGRLEQIFLRVIVSRHDASRESFA